MVDGVLVGPELEKKFPSSRGELEREKASKINIHLPAGGFFFFWQLKWIWTKECRKPYNPECLFSEIKTDTLNHSGKFKSKMIACISYYVRIILPLTSFSIFLKKYMTFISSLGLYETRAEMFSYVNKGNHYLYPQHLPRHLDLKDW